MTKCPKCRARSSVTDARPTRNSMRRRRMCNKCGTRWTTWEIPADLLGVQETFETQATEIRRRLRSLERELVRRSFLISTALRAVQHHNSGKTRSRSINYRKPDHYWTHDKVILMRRHYPTHGAPMLAERFGKTLAAVRSKARLLGLRKEGYGNGHASARSLPEGAGPEIRSENRDAIRSSPNGIHGPVDIQQESGGDSVL
jgi:hypothetical protein